MNGYSKEWQKKWAKMQKDPINIKRWQDMETLFAAIAILVELKEMDAAYELRVLHDTHFFPRRRS